MPGVSARKLWRIESVSGKPATPAPAEAVATEPKIEPAAQATGNPAIAATPTSAPTGDPNAIERPAFRDANKPFVKSQASIRSLTVRVAENGQMVGAATDVIGTVMPDAKRQGLLEVRFVGEVGQDMSTSLSEAVRAVRVRYPQVAGGVIELSFEERYDRHDGGSAGAAFGTLLLSLLEGIELDPRVAMTGDLTVDWKVRRVGGVTAKLRGAQLDKCALALIPATNAETLSDAVLLYDDTVLWDVQVFSIATLQEAARMTSTQRDAKVAEAIKLFGDLQSRRSSSNNSGSASSGRAFLNNAETRKSLEHIVELAPNHLSAKQLLAIAKGTAPKQLSVNASLYQFSVAAYPYRTALFTGDRGGLTKSTAANARKALSQLKPIADRRAQPLVAAFLDFVNACERATPTRNNDTEIDESRKTVIAKLQDLRASREMVEQLVREGF
jgi:hypothetical protein